MCWYSRQFCYGAAIVELFVFEMFFSNGGLILVIQLENYTREKEDRPYTDQMDKCMIDAFSLAKTRDLKPLGWTKRFTSDRVGLLNLNKKTSEIR